MNETELNPQATRSPRGRWRRTWLTAGAVLTVAALLVGSLGVATVWAVVRGADTKSESTSQSYPRAPARVEVDMALGAVSIAGQDTERVDVQRDLTWSRAKPTVDETWAGDTFRVDTKCPNAHLVWVSQECSIDYEAQVPRDAAADVRSSTAPIDIRDLGGEVTLTSTTGNITIDDVTGPLSARASTGDITGSNLRSSRTNAETSTGDLTLQFTETPDHVEADASTGNITIELPRDDDPYRVDVQTSTGERQVDVAQDPEAERVIDVATSTGNVHIRYTPDSAPASGESSR